MKLFLALRHDHVTTLEALHVELTLENDGTTAVTIPGTSDVTDALTLEARRPGGGAVVRMNGLTRQALMNSGRIDETPRLETLEPGARWNWSLDLARYYYPLPAGAYELVAEYQYAPADIRLQSAPLPVTVAAAALLGRCEMEDAPVLDGLTLLLRAAEAEQPFGVLRQHNAPRPLAAWYSDMIEGDRATRPPAPPIAWDGPTPPFLAAARYRTSESFDPTFVKWLIATDGRKLRAYCFEWGRPDPVAASASLPDGLELLDSASYDGDNRLWLAFRRPDGAVEVHEMQPRRLARLFELPLPHTPLPPALRWDCDALHVITPHDGALYHRLAHDGTVEISLRVADSALPAFHRDFDPFQKRARLIHFDPAFGERRLPAIELTVVGPEPETVAHVRLDDPLPGRQLTELAFDMDAAGGFHLLAGTDAEELYYLRPGEPPALVASGEARWWPLVRARRGAQVGFFQAATGYRFARVRAGRLVIPSGVPGEES